MKHLLPGIAALGVVAFAAPALAQQQCDSAVVTHALDRPFTRGRHQVLAPRDSASLPSQRLVARRVRTTDGSGRVRRYVTKSGVPVTKHVTKQKPPACAPVPRTPETSVGEVALPLTPSTPIAAPGEVIPSALPIVGSRFPFPLLGGLLLGGTAVAVGSHTPGSASTPTEVTPTPPGTPTAPTVPAPPTTPTTPTTPTPTTPTTPTPTTPTTPTPTTPTTPSTPVPEPMTVVLVGGGLLLAGGLARRRR